MITDTIKQAILKVLPEQLRVEVQLEHPSQEEHGDYSTNIALRLFKSLAGKEQDNLLPIPPEARISPKTFAEWLVDRLK
jgi:arginyl-tRNA synthetase